MFLGKNVLQYDISAVAEMVKKSKGKRRDGGRKIEMKGWIRV